MSIGLIITSPIIQGSGTRDGKNCSVELLGLAIYGNYTFGYSLPCLDRPSQDAVVTINDRLSEETRQSKRWRLLVARLALCHRHSNPRLYQRMALWAARSVEHLADDPRVKACNDTLERWLAGEATDSELHAARLSAIRALDGSSPPFYAPFRAVSSAVHAANCALGECEREVDDQACHTVSHAASAIDDAATAGSRDADDAMIEWLDAYLTAWMKTAVDEGEAIPSQADEEYEAFVAQLDSLLERLGMNEEESRD